MGKRVKGFSQQSAPDRVDWKLRIEKKKEEEKKDDKWTLSITGLLLDEAGSGIPDTEILFRVDGDSYESPEITDVDGRVTKEFSLPAGKHVILAEVVSRPGVRSNRIPLNFKDEEGGKKKIPKDILIAKFGSLGKYTLGITVVDEGGKGIEAVVEIGSEYGKEKELSTSKNGYLDHALEFKEKSRRYEIKAGGVVRVIPLSGPIMWKGR